ncbi:hypothetical protein LXL04_023825 [Taraxacum kok-saghyz]
MAIEALSPGITCWKCYHFQPSSQLFGETEYGNEHDILHITLEDTANRSIGRCKVDDILGNPSTYEKGGVYYYSERGDRLINLNAFRDTLWQKCNFENPHNCSFGSEAEVEQVSITCMAKLRNERFINPSVLNADTVTCVDVIMTRRMENGACHSILYKIMMAILKHDTSEPVRRRQYTLLLSYFQYCQHILDPHVPTTILQSLLVEEQESGDLDLEKIDQDQAELARANLSILRKEAQYILYMTIKDATQGSESGRIMALFVLDVS